MNLLKNKLAAKMMLVAMMILGTGSIFAANKIYLGDLPAIQTYDEVRLPVMMDCDENATGFQFNVILPKTLELKNIELNTERRVDHIAQYGIKNGVPTFVVMSPNFSSFVGNTGVIAYLRVKVVDGALKTPSVSPIKLEAIKVSGENGSVLVNGESDVKEISIGEVSKIEATLSSQYVSPNGKFTVNIGINNTVPTHSMQLDVELPAGFTFDCSANGRLKVVNGPRLTVGSSVSGKPKDNKVTIVASTYTQSPILAADDYGKGDYLFSFDVIAPAEFAEKGEIVVSNVVVSLPSGVESACEGISVEISNSSKFKADADAEVKALKDALAAAIAEIAEKYADVKDQFTGADITTNITTLEQAIAAAYGNNTLASKYDEVMAPKADITAAIAKLVEDAKAAQAKVDADKALKAAAEKAAAEIKALNDKLAAALESIAKNCPLVADDFKGENVAAAIKALQAKVDAAVADGSLTEKYDEVMANTIGELIDTLVKEAEIAQAAAVEAEAAEKARKENNEKAYKEDLAAIDELTAKLQAEIKALEDHFNAIGETEPNWVLVEQTNILVKIRDLKTKADNENDRVAKEGDYRKQVDALDTMLVNQLIAAYVANVKTSGIDSIISDENLGNVRIYTIDGVQHNTLVPGVNIIVKEDGTTTKVYVK